MDFLTLLLVAVLLYLSLVGLNTYKVYKVFQNARLTISVIFSNPSIVLWNLPESAKQDAWMIKNRMDGQDGE